jgi:hypothetical protein
MEGSNYAAGDPNRCDFNNPILYNLDYARSLPLRCVCSDDGMRAADPLG